MYELIKIRASVYNFMFYLCMWMFGETGAGENGKIDMGGGETTSGWKMEIH